MPAEQHDATTEFNEALKAAFDDGKYDELGSFYTEDSVLLPPRGRPIEGRGPVSGFWRGVKARFAGMVFTTTGLKSLGETAKRETGTYATVTADGAANPVEGKYVFVWQLVDGEWQIESTIWNRSGAPGQGQGRQAQAGGQGRAVGPRGGQRRQGAGGQGAGAQGAGYRQGGDGGYRQGGQGGQGGGRYRQAGGGYRQGGQGGGRPSFQGGGGIGGGGRRGGGGGPRRGGGQGGGQGGAQGGGPGGPGSPYEQSGGLYSDLKE